VHASFLAVNIYCDQQSELSGAMILANAIILWPVQRRNLAKITNGEDFT